MNDNMEQKCLQYPPRGWEQQDVNIRDNDLIHVTIILIMNTFIKSILKD